MMLKFTVDRFLGMKFVFTISISHFISKNLFLTDQLSFSLAGVGLLLHDSVLLLQGLLLYVVLVAVLHPLDAVDVRQEGFPLLVEVAGE